MCALIVLSVTIPCTNSPRGVRSLAPRAREPETDIAMLGTARHQPTMIGTETQTIITARSCPGPGCGWTLQYSCPGQPRGSKGYAGDDGSEGYRCCCGAQTHQPIATSDSTDVTEADTEAVRTRINNSPCLRSTQAHTRVPARLPMRPRSCEGTSLMGNSGPRKVDGRQRVIVTVLHRFQSSA